MYEIGQGPDRRPHAAPDLCNQRTTDVGELGASTREASLASLALRLWPSALHVHESVRSRMGILEADGNRADKPPTEVLRHTSGCSSATVMSVTLHTPMTNVGAESWECTS